MHRKQIDELTIRGLFFWLSVSNIRACQGAYPSYFRSSSDPNCVYMEYDLTDNELKLRVLSGIVSTTGDAPKFTNNATATIGCKAF